jgi:hypothetical protein
MLVKANQKNLNTMLNKGRFVDNRSKLKKLQEHRQKITQSTYYCKGV